MTSNGPNYAPNTSNKSPGRVSKFMPNENSRPGNSNVMVFHGAASNKHPSVAIKSVEEVRRNGLNMEKMIKKNVMTSSSKNPLKRGLAVVEYFKNKNKQNGEAEEEDRNKKKQLFDRPMPPVSVSAAQISVVPSSSKQNIPTNRPGSSLIQQRNKSPSMNMSNNNSNKKVPVNAAEVTMALTSPPRPSPQVLSTSSMAASMCSPSRALKSPPLREKGIAVPSPRKAKELPEPCPEDKVSSTDINLQPKNQLVSPFESFRSKQHDKRKLTSPKPGNTLIFPPRTASTPPRLGARLPPSTSSPSSAVKSAPVIPATTRSPARSSASTPPPYTKRKTSAPPPLPLVTNISSKSMCFSIETIATSLDVTPDGECILVGFANGSVRLYEMDSKVSSDRYGYLLGHLDEATGASPNGSYSSSSSNSSGSDGSSTHAMTVRLKISSDGRYVFVGTRTGLRAIMSIHLQHYRHGNEDEDDEESNTQDEDDEDDGQDIKKHYHMDAKLRGFADVAKSSVYYQGRNRNAYYLLFGLGVGTFRMWRFIETHRGPVWEHLYGISAGGNTLSMASFVYNSNRMVEGLMSICVDKNLRVWQLEEEENHEEEEEEGAKRLVVKGHKDVPNCKEIVDVQGNFAYGITIGGDLYRIQLFTSSSCSATTLGKRQQFELEVLDTSSTPSSTASMNFSSGNASGCSGRRSGRSNAATGGKSLIENCYATADGRSVIAVSTDGVFYYYNTIETQADETSDILWMKIIGRLGGSSWSGSNGSKSPPVRLYEPTSSSSQAMMAVVSNAAHGAGNGFFTVDAMQAYAMRWDQKRENVEKNQTDFDHLLAANWPDAIKSQRYREYQRLKIQGVLNECWNCSARDVFHWEKATTAHYHHHHANKSSTPSNNKAKNSSISSSKEKPTAPRLQVGSANSASPIISLVSPSNKTSKSSKPNNKSPHQSQKSPKANSSSANTTPTIKMSSSSKHKKRIIQDDDDDDDDDDDEDAEEESSSGGNNKKHKTSTGSASISAGGLQVRIQTLEQEVARYKERYDRIEAEWQRRLKAERQLRRLWKTREAQYQQQVSTSQTQLNRIQQQFEEAEKRFAHEKLKADQQNSVKTRYEKLCELTQEKLHSIDVQQKLMEQTTQTLLQEVERQVSSLKNWAGNEKNECIICKEQEAVMAIVPCGHLCFCEEDAQQYRRQMQQQQRAKCPVCDTELISFLRIY